VAEGSVGAGMGTGAVPTGSGKVEPEQAPKIRTEKSSSARIRLFLW